ncbi:MAG: hypothetical protein HY327_07025 [Chloroflexi bacterium]|nr:hypothetical protein [Chloroflexota bacterium]
MLALFAALLFLSALPLFGRAWHRVLPEHAHLFFSASARAADDLFANDSVPLSNFSAPRLTANSKQITLHLPDPALSFQFLSLAIGLFAGFAFVQPREIFLRLPALVYLYQPPYLALLNPPPKTSNLQSLISNL